ncbi:MAG: hypothetical protein ACE5IR_23335, partial [bacterium]
MKKIFFTLHVSLIAILTLTTDPSFAQTSAESSNSNRVKPYSDIARKIIETALSERQAYSMLRQLTHDVGPRLSGSSNAAAAVE